VDPKFRIEQISSYIDEIYSQNELCAFFNEMGLLEIFMVNENMVKILNIQKNTKVRLDFND
jgi:S-adenosylmethionine hydrolase